MDIKRQCTFNALIVFHCAILGTVLGQTYEHATNLRAALLSDYNKDVRPLNNQSDILHVNISLDVFGMPDVDDVRGVITITVMTQCIWIDERMIWNPNDYGGISKIPILINEVWTPSISLGTPVEFATMGSKNHHVTFFANGLAFFYPGDVLKSSCKFNMKFWPFDKQICDVGFFPMDYGVDQVLFSIPSDGLRTTSFSPNAEWMLDETEHYVLNAGFSQAHFKLKLIRQSLFYVLTIILPINGIAGLTCLVFILPSESGERVSYAITIMLSLAVFLTVVSAEMPKSAEPISLMCCYILAGIIVSVIGIILAIFNLVLYHRHENVPKAPWYISIVLLSRCKRRNKSRDETEDIQDKLDIKNATVSKMLHEKRNYKTSVKSVKADTIWQSHEDSITWKDVSHAIDKLLFYAMVLLTYIPSIVFLVYLGVASDYQTSKSI